MSHSIVALWVHPRSMSTATERIMRERGDCTVFHEPFLVDYYLHRAIRQLPLLEEDKTKARDYDAVRKLLLDAAETTPVFFKDMSYYVVPRIYDDPAFARRIENIFLIRDPRLSIASFAKLDPDFSRVEVGLEAQWEHYGFLSDTLGLDPVVIEAEAVAEDPERVVGNLWQRIGWPHVAGAFQWQATSTPDDWQYVAGWHKDAVASTGIQRDDRDPQAVFDKAAEKIPHLRDYLAHHLEFYERLRSVARTTCQA